jgi:hypothetical protein
MPNKSKKGNKSGQKEKKKSVSILLNGPQVYAIGALGDWTQYDFRIGFYADVTSEKDDPKKKIYILGTQVILSPRATKELSTWLSKHVDEYEKEHGVIKTTEMLKSEKK